MRSGINLIMLNQTGKKCACVCGGNDTGDGCTIKFKLGLGKGNLTVGQLYFFNVPFALYPFAERLALQ